MLFLGKVVRFSTRISEKEYSFTISQPLPRPLSATVPWLAVKKKITKVQISMFYCKQFKRVVF